jgi:hypothetical protein
MWRTAVLIGLLVTLAAVARGTAGAQTSTTAFVIGRVVDAETGEPIRGAQVILASVGTPGARRTQPPPRPAIVVTNAEGGFQISALPFGRWRLNVQEAGYYFPGNTPPPAFEISSARVTLPDIRLETGGAIAGRVLDGRRRGAGALTVTALLRARRPDGTIGPGPGRAEVTTNDLGDFRLAGLPPGEYYVVAQPRVVPPTRPDPAPSSTAIVATYYPGVTDAIGATAVTVTRGGTTQAIDFQVAIEAAYYVMGVAFDPDGRPAAGAIVELVRIGGSLATGAWPRGTAAPDGTFRIVNVPNGTYRVSAGIPVIDGASISLSMRAAVSVDPPEVIVSGGDATGVRVVVRQP